MWRFDGRSPAILRILHSCNAIVDAAVHHEAIIPGGGASIFEVRSLNDADEGACVVARRRAAVPTTILIRTSANHCASLSGRFLRFNAPTRLLREVC
jgi:hypothetical protein